MKKMFLIAAMMVATLTASAQSNPGTFSIQPKVGIGFSKITDDEAKFKFGIGAGVEGQYQIFNWLAASGGVMYQQMGSKIKDQDGIDMSDVKINLDYIQIPMMAKFYVAKGLSLGAGIQPGFLTKAKIKVGGEYGKLLKEYGGADEVDIKDNVEKFDLCFPLCVAYELPMGLFFEARYNYGVTDVAKDYDHGDKKNSNFSSYIDDKNLLFQLTVGYKIPF